MKVNWNIFLAQESPETDAALARINALRQYHREAADDHDNETRAALTEAATTRVLGEVALVEPYKILDRAATQHQAARIILEDVFPPEDTI